MKIQVKSEFTDKYTNKEYAVGDVIEIDDKERVNTIVYYGLGVVIESEAKADEKPAEPEAEVKAEETEVTAKRRTRKHKDA